MIFTNIHSLDVEHQQYPCWMHSTTSSQILFKRQTHWFRRFGSWSMPALSRLPVGVREKMGGYVGGEGFRYIRRSFRIHHARLFGTVFSFQILRQGKCILIYCKMIFTVYTYLFIYLPTYLSIYLSIYLSTCTFSPTAMTSWNLD